MQLVRRTSQSELSLSKFVADCAASLVLVLESSRLGPIDHDDPLLCGLSGMEALEADFLCFGIRTSNFC